MSEIYIKTLNNSILNVAGKDYYGATSTGGWTSGEIHIRSDVSGKFICWSGTDGTRYCAKGVSVGSTSEPQGSIWAVLGDSDELRFSHGGTSYSIDRIQIKNEISNTSLKIYSDSGRTNLLSTVSYNSTVTLDPYRSTLYFTSQGLGDNPVSYNFSGGALKAGHLYDVRGTYVQGQDAVYECQCNWDGSEYVSVLAGQQPPSPQSSCPERSSDNNCFGTAEDKTCDYVYDSFNSSIDFDEYKVYRCETVTIVPSANGYFSVNPSLVLV